MPFCQFVNERIKKAAIANSTTAASFHLQFCYQFIYIFAFLWTEFVCHLSIT